MGHRCKRGVYFYLFGSEVMIAKMQSFGNQRYYADGTYRVVLKGCFTQLFDIHLESCKCFHFVYNIFPIYSSMMVDNCNRNAFWKEFRFVYPQCEWSGCYYHFTQAVRQNIQITTVK